MQRIHNVKQMKQEIEAAASHFINQADEVSFRATDQAMFWTLDIDDSRYSIQYANGMIDVYMESERFASFYPYQMEEFGRFVSSLEERPEVANNYEAIQSLTNESRDYDLKILDNNPQLDINFQNGLIMQSIVSETGEAAYCLHYDNTTSFIPISFEDGAIRIDNTSVPASGSLEEISEISKQLSGIDKKELAELIQETRHERLNDIHNQLMGASAELYNSADRVDFYVNRDYDAMRLDFDTSTGKYTLVVDDGKVSISHDKESLGRFYLDDMDLIKKAINDENKDYPVDRLYKLPEGLTDNAYNYEVKNVNGVTEFSIAYNNGLEIAGNINEFGGVTYTAGFDTPTETFRIGIDDGKIHLLDSGEPTKMVHIDEFSEYVSKVSRLSSSEIEQKIAMEELGLSSKEIHNKLMDATSSLHEAAIGVSFDVDEKTGIAKLGYNVVDSNNATQHYEFVMGDKTVTMIHGDSVMAKWSLDELDKMSEFLSNLDLDKSNGLTALPDSLIKGASSYSISDFKDTFGTEDFSVKYENGLVLNGSINTEGEVAYKLLFEHNGEKVVLDMDDGPSIDKVSTLISEFSEMSTARIVETIEFQNFSIDNTEIINDKIDELEAVLDEFDKGTNISNINNDEPDMNTVDLE